jgi:hypothetical protein
MRSALSGGFLLTRPAAEQQDHLVTFGSLIVAPSADTP